MFYLENDKLSVNISENGAELFSIKSKSSGREFLWQGEPDIWKGRSPLLFPVVGRVKDDEIITEKGTFFMPKHGFARKSVFYGSKISPSEACFSLFSSDDTKKSYPYDLSFM